MFFVFVFCFLIFFIFWSTPLPLRSICKWKNGRFLETRDGKLKKTEKTEETEKNWKKQLLWDRWRSGDTIYLKMFLFFSSFFIFSVFQSFSFRSTPRHHLSERSFFKMISVSGPDLPDLFFSVFSVFCMYDRQTRRKHVLGTSWISSYMFRLVWKKSCFCMCLFSFFHFSVFWFCFVRGFDP